MEVMLRSTGWLAAPGQQHGSDILNTNLGWTECGDNFDTFISLKHSFSHISDKYGLTTGRMNDSKYLNGN